MKKGFYAALCAVMMLCASCHDSIWDAINALDGRVAKLEELCKEMNTNISSLKTIVDVMQSNDYITGITEIKKGNEVIGYTITFGKHAPITIYNGEDGKNGADGLNGTDGKDGHTPIITVAQDEDGVYYWKIDGKWLTDEQGNKMRVTGENGKDGKDGNDGADGKDGKDGADGKDGQDGNDGANGQDGQDGVTPQLKIENDYWYISYNGGTSWIQLGKAVGADGKDGKNGKDGTDGKNGQDGQNGQDGDSMFKSVTQDDNYVYFTLADDSVIKIAKNKDAAGNVIIENGAIKAAFSVSDTSKVYFSQGNLQFNVALGTHKRADGTTANGTWRFAEQQYFIIGADNGKMSSTYNGWIDLFGWGTSGYDNTKNDRYAKHFLPYDNYHEGKSLSSTNTSGYGPSSNMADINLVGTSQYYDWGIYNPISNGGNVAGIWRVLTKEEWDYLLRSRPNAGALKFHATVNSIKGYILLPDDYVPTQEIDFTLNAGSATNTYTNLEWIALQNHGAIFLPIAGTLKVGTVGDYYTHYLTVYTQDADDYSRQYALYWTASAYDVTFACSFTGGSAATFDMRERHISVRLVKDIKQK